MRVMRVKKGRRDAVQPVLLAASPIMPSHGQRTVVRPSPLIPRHYRYPVHVQQKTTPPQAACSGWSATRLLTAAVRKAAGRVCEPELEGCTHRGSGGAQVIAGGAGRGGGQELVLHCRHGCCSSRCSFTLSPPFSCAVRGVVKCELSAPPHFLRHPMPPSKQQRATAWPGDARHPTRHCLAWPDLRAPAAWLPRRPGPGPGCRPSRCPTAARACRRGTPVRAPPPAPPCGCGAAIGC